RLLFFFSSRRRHTRCLSDWSSTCALPIYEGRRGDAIARPAKRPKIVGIHLPDRTVPPLRARRVRIPRSEGYPRDARRAAPARWRSEERRVGEERRARAVPARLRE